MSFEFSDLFSADCRLITLLLIILPLLAYGQVYDFEFVWDDFTHLKNPFVLNPSWVDFWQLFTKLYFGMYIPVTYLVWGLLKSLAEFLTLPLNSILHISNVLVHIINGLLVFTLLRQFIINKWAVLIGTLFFLLHPIQVEVVAWVSELRTLLAFCFSLTALYVYLKNQTKFSLLSLCLYALALLSKPSAVVLPLMIFTIHYFHYNFSLIDNIKKTLPFAIWALVAAIIIINTQSYSVDADYIINSIQRPIVWLDSIVFYLYQIILPINLNPIYQNFSAQFVVNQWWFYLFWLIPLVFGLLLWIGRTKYTLLIFASVVFLIGFLPTSGLVTFVFQELSIIADRYLYFSMVGIALTVAGMTDRKRWRMMMLGVLSIFVLLTIFKQTLIWKAPIELWSYAVQHNSTYAKDALGAAFSNKSLTLIEQGNLKLALRYIDKALGISGGKKYDYVVESYYNKGRIYLRQQKPRQAEHAFSQAIDAGANMTKTTERQKIEYSNYFYNRGVVKAQQNKLQSATDDFAKTLELNPNNNKARNDKIYAHILLKQCKQAQQEIDFMSKHKLKLLPNIQTVLQQQCPNQ